MNGPLEYRLHRLEPVALASVGECASMRTRKDRKYIVDAELLARAIDRIGEEMQVLEIEGIRWFTYRSVYFDTPDYDAYRLAAHRRPNRYKVRSRTYLDEGTTVLEVKTKDRAGQTVKHRLTHDGGAGDLDSAARAFASSVQESSVHAENLVPVLTTSYLRATLLFPESEVRATIDSDYSVCDRDGREVGFSAELIVETKTNGRPCALDRALWALGARPQTISKYCTGLAAIHPELPSNRWNRVLQRYFPHGPALGETRPDPDGDQREHKHNGIGDDNAGNGDDRGRNRDRSRSQRRNRPRRTRTGRASVLTAAVAATVALVAAGCGTVGSASESSGSVAESAVSADPVASDAVFDSSTVHSISVDLDEADYEAMIDTYLSTEDKEWLEATVTIDGETYEQAGIRLKGNSSLRGLSGAGGGTGGEVSSDDPSSLPWLIKLDKYVDDQNHEGVNDFVVRSNTSESSLNEALALELLDEAGLATQGAIAGQLQCQRQR
ncbi:MAG: VTC domain-containing protein [Microthrixaceae bacterium]